MKNILLPTFLSNDIIRHPKIYATFAETYRIFIQRIMKIARNLLATATAILLTIPPTGAVPARKQTRAYITDSGETVSLTAYGDETFHYLEAEDGKRYFLSEAGIATPADSVEFHKKFESTAHLRAMKRSWSNPTYPRTGSPKVPVILVQFTDRAFSFGKDDFSRMMNEHGYSDYGAGGSAADYFADNSCGVFTPQFDVYGPVTLGGPIADYGTNDAYGNDANAHLMVAEACRALDDQIDFSDYDEDGDGMADIIYVFYAGFGENDGGSSSTVWPHTSSLAGKGVSLTLDGVSINSYSCSNELQNGYGRTLTGIGTFCHEYTHVLGFPDLYATMAAERYGWTPDAWTLMDQGSYNNNSRTPAAYTAYERMSMGWLTPVEATGNALAMLPPIDSNRALRVSTDASDDEFFLIEHRARQGWDAYLPGEGLLVWHIDYDPGIWNANTVNNNPDHLRVRLIPADGLWADNERPGIAFRNGTIELPAWIGNPLSALSIDRTEAGYIGVSVNAGAEPLASPQSVSATEIRDKEATFGWQPVDGATRYIVTVTDCDGRYLADMTNMPSATPSATITGLQPETLYNIRVAACTDGADMGKDCGDVAFTTDIPGLSFTRPEMPELTALGHDSFSIGWQPYSGAEYYLLNVWRDTDGPALKDVCGFDNGLDLPEGWKTTCSSTFAVQSYCGESKPSIVMANHGEYVESPEYSGDITSISFYIRGRNTDESASLLTEGMTESGWTTIATTAVTTSVQTPEMTLPQGVKAIRITLSNTSAKGTAMLDDVELTFGKETVRDYVLHDFEVRDATSHTLSSLEPECEYFVTLRAADSHDISLESETASITTGPASGIQGDTTLTSADDDSSYVVTDAAGRVVATGSGDIKNLPLPSPGIYLVKKGSAVKKIAIK